MKRRRETRAVILDALVDPTIWRATLDDPVRRSTGEGPALVLGRRSSNGKEPPRIHTEAAARGRRARRRPLVPRSARAAAAPAERRRVLVASSSAARPTASTWSFPFGDPEYYSGAPAIAIAPRRAGNGGRSTSTASSACIRACAAPAALRDAASWPWSTRSARPTRRARTSTPRTSWKPARPGNKSDADGWLNRYLPSRPGTARPVHSAQSRSGRCSRVARGAGHRRSRCPSLDDFRPARPGETQAAARLRVAVPQGRRAPRQPLSRPTVEARPAAAAAPRGRSPREHAPATPGPPGQRAAPDRAQLDQGGPRARDRLRRTWAAGTTTSNEGRIRASSRPARGARAAR